MLQTMAVVPGGSARELIKANRTSARFPRAGKSFSFPFLRLIMPCRAQAFLLCHSKFVTQQIPVGFPLRPQILSRHQGWSGMDQSLGWGRAEKARLLQERKKGPQPTSIVTR